MVGAYSLPRIYYDDKFVFILIKMMAYGEDEEKFMDFCPYLA